MKKYILITLLSIILFCSGCTNKKEKYDTVIQNIITLLEDIDKADPDKHYLLDNGWYKVNIETVTYDYNTIIINKTELISNMELIYELDRPTLLNGKIKRSEITIVKDKILKEVYSETVFDKYKCFMTETISENNISTTKTYGYDHSNDQYYNGFTTNIPFDDFYIIPRDYAGMYMLRYNDTSGLKSFNYDNNKIIMSYNDVLPLEESRQIEILLNDNKDCVKITQHGTAFLNSDKIVTTAILTHADPIDISVPTDYENIFSASVLR